MAQVNVRIGCQCNGTKKCAVCRGTGEFKKNITCRSCCGSGQCRCVVERVQNTLLTSRGDDPKKIGDLAREFLASLRPSTQ